MTVTATLAEARINSRNENGGTLRDRLEDLRGKLEEVVTLVTNSKEQINQAKDKSVDAKAEVDNAKEVIERARDSLKTAKRILEDEGRDALRLAEERSKKFGAESERMSAIAREARRLAEQWVLSFNPLPSIFVISLLLFWMGDGAARHRSALRTTEPCRVMTYHNKSLLSTLINSFWQTVWTLSIEKKILLY